MCSENRSRANGLGNGLQAPEWRFVGLTAYDNSGKLQLAGEHARQFANALDVRSDHSRRVTFQRSRHLGGGSWRVESGGGCGGSRIVATIQVKRGGVVVTDVADDDIAGQLDELQERLEQRAFGTQDISVTHRRGNITTTVEVNTDDPKEVADALTILTDAVAPDQSAGQTSGLPAGLPPELASIMAIMAA